jgi:hypothetical protein
MASAYEYLVRLSRHPHRGTATPGEVQAANDLAEWLREMGYTVTLQPFRTPRDTLYLGPSMVMVGFLLALVAGLWLPWLAILLCAAFLLPMAGELLGSRWLDLDWLLPTYPSQNVVARKAPVGTVEQTVVISAHYDTQRASWLFHPRVAPYLQYYFPFLYALLVAVLVLLGARSAGAAWSGPAMAVVGALLLAQVAFLLACWRTGRYINGANDNGSGVAVALGLAERFARGGLPGTELIVLLTGAEEVGTRGMKAFVRSCGLDPTRTRFVNLDNLGGGTLHYLQGEGMLAFRPYRTDQVVLARQMADEIPGKVRSKRNLLLPTDGLIPTLAGYPAISFLAFGDDGSLPNYHWYTDTVERVDKELLEFVEAFVMAYVQRLAGLSSTA